ncbi:MAG: L,D-transpeptidase [Longispora sp.]|nr:L,D-transpeptidase [Longispora sp. (in: high G+C Gram-positive bacteria)]
MLTSEQPTNNRPHSRPAAVKFPLSSGFALLIAALAAGYLAPIPEHSISGSAPPVRPSTAPTTAPQTLPAAAAPADLPVIAYEAISLPFPPDPEPQSRGHLSEGLHPNTPIALYDAPGGTPLAVLRSTIRGVPITMPIVRRESGWVAVLLPSINRAVGWVPPGDWSTVPLRDQLVVSRRAYTMTWFRDSVARQTWDVTLGVETTPTPLGRSFILGRSSLDGDVYADTDVFALGSVSENPERLPAGLRNAHTGIHTWQDDRTLRQNASDGCIRLTKSGQQLLLRELIPGTAVVVVD